MGWKPVAKKKLLAPYLVKLAPPRFAVSRWWHSLDSWIYEPAKQNLLEMLGFEFIVNTLKSFDRFDVRMHFQRTSN